MNDSIQLISIPQLLISFIPVVVVLIILYRWRLNVKESAYAISRMLLQLAIVGYALAYIFSSDSLLIVVLILSVMIIASSWIALRTIEENRKKYFGIALYAIAAGGGFTLIVIVLGVLNLDKWFDARYVVPLAGMIFANCMNSVSLAAERYLSERNRGENYLYARNTAMKAALIPITNSLFAVGLVSLPGMMTGQILSGIDPLIAARYQIVVMCMIYASAGISSAVFLKFVENKT